MKEYPLDKFPNINMRPEVVIKHKEHLDALKDDIIEYSKVGHRDTIMFDWLLRVFENLGLSTVRKEYLDSLAITKTRLALFVVLIDDPVDNIKKRNFKLFEELLKIPFNPEQIDKSQFNVHDVEYLEFTKNLWTEITNEITKYPDHKRYKEAFEFDIKQLLNSMSYSRFVNTYPNAINLTENDAYVHHSMIVLIEMDIDLMCSQGFDEREFGALRELGYISQKMAKIGNIIGTYPRELIESDMSSRAVVKFLTDNGADFGFKLNKLIKKEMRYPEFEKNLTDEWQKEYLLTIDLSKRIKSINTQDFIKQLEFVQKAYQIKTDYW